MKQKLLKSLLMIVCLLFGVGTTWADNATWTASSAGYANQAEVSNVTVNSNISITMAKGTNSNAPKYYTSGTAVRAYGGNTIAVNATNATITSITFTFGSSDGSNEITADKGTFNSSSWSGSEDAVTFTIGGTSGNRRIAEISVTYTTSGTGGGSTPTKYTVTVANNIANGTVSASSTSAAAGTEVTLTATPSTGYEFGSWNVTDASSNAITVTNNKFTMPAANVNVSATFNAIQGGGEPSGDEYTHDVLTNADFAATGTSYTAFTNVSKNTAVYAGQSSKNNGIQLRATSPSGIVSSTTGGKIKAVTVSWNSNCAAGRVIDVYGSNTAYTSAADLYNNTKQGTKLGSIVMGTSTSVTVTGDYAYVGIRSNSGALNIDEIDFAWEEDGGDDTPAGDPQISDFIKTANLKLETGAAPYDIRNALNIPNDYDQNTYAITTTINGLTEKDDEFACVYPYLSFQKAGSYTVNVTAAAVAGKYAETSGNINVTVTDPINTTFASLEELVAATLTSNTEVTVSFENVPIKSIYVTSAGYRNGIFFDIQKGGNDIEIYYQNVPEEWVAGGTVSGTLTCPWKQYSGTWELAPATGTWGWNNLTYNAPAATYEVNLESVTNGTISASVSEAAEGVTVTLTATPEEGYEFESWYVLDGEANEVTVTNNHITMPASDVYVSATFVAEPANVIFDLTTDQTAEATEELLAWSSDYVSMRAEKADAGTATNNYYPGTSGQSYKSTRFYKNSTLTLNPVQGVSIIKVIYEATSIGYATALVESDWTNATASANNQTVTITPTDGTKSISAVMSNTTGATRVKVFYAGEPSSSVNGTINFVATNDDGYWATFTSTENVIFDANDVVVYTVAVDDNSLVVMDADGNSLSCVTDKTKDDGWVAGYYVQAGAAVLINSLEESVNYYFIDTDPYTANDLNDIETDPKYNMLRPASVAKETDGSYLFYKLAYGGWPEQTKLGFWWGEDEGAPFVSKEGGVYLAVPASTSLSNMRGFSFNEEGNLTGIEAVMTTNDNVIYNLQGQRVSRLQQGVNIVNGCKVIR